MIQFLKNLFSREPPESKKESKDKTIGAHQACEQSIIDAAEKRLARALSEDEKFGLKHLSFMMMESIERDIEYESISEIEKTFAYFFEDSKTEYAIKVRKGLYGSSK